MTSLHYYLGDTMIDEEIVLSHLKVFWVCSKNSNEETPINRMWWGAQLLFKMEQISCLPGDILDAPQKSILSITWTLCINYGGSRIHYSPQLFSKSVLYQTWSDAIKQSKRFNLASYSVSHGRNNTSVFLTRKAVS